MKRTLKTISMTLDQRSINAAIREIQKFQTDLKDALGKLCNKLLDEGVDMAKIEVAALGAFDSGALEASIGRGAFDPASGTGIVYAGAYYAFFVEYGTGVVGAENPHPGLQAGIGDPPLVMGSNGNIYTGYDSQGHGDAGWVYRNDRGEWHWTKGYRSRPFMYNTLMYLRDYAEREGGNIIATFLPGGG